MTRKRLAAHFVVEEFDSGDGALVPAARWTDLQRLCAWWLEPLRAEFGPVTVLSGYRSFAHNSAVGGALASVHLLRTAMPDRGRGGVARAAAADVSCARGSSVLWQQWASKHRQRHHELVGHGRGGIGSYRNFVHLDTAAARDWTL